MVLRSATLGNNLIIDNRLIIEGEELLSGIADTEPMFVFTVTGSPLALFRLASLCVSLCLEIKLFRCLYNKLLSVSWITSNKGKGEGKVNL
jgi:hypothetical protein